MKKARVNVLDSDWAMVPRILSSEKRLSGRLRDLTLRLTGKSDSETGGSNRRDWVHEQPVRTVHGEIPVKLRICAGLRSSIPESWTAAIIVFNERVDGICHHVKAPDCKGGFARGWHRHQWNETKRSCKAYRNELRGFDPGETFESFISVCCGQLGVILEDEGGRER